MHGAPASDASRSSCSYRRKSIHQSRIFPAHSFSASSVMQRKIPNVAGLQVRKVSFVQKCGHSRNAIGSAMNGNRSWGNNTGQPEHRKQPDPVQTGYRCMWEHCSIVEAYFAWDSAASDRQTANLEKVRLPHGGSTGLDRGDEAQLEENRASTVNSEVDP